MEHHEGVEHRQQGRCRMPPIDEIPRPGPSNVRKGRFLWLDEPTKKRYLNRLKRKIEDGYFFSDIIIGRIVEEIAPAVEDALDREISASY